MSTKLSILIVFVDVLVWSRSLQSRIDFLVVWMILPMLRILLGSE